MTKRSNTPSRSQASRYREAARKIAQGEEEGVVFALGKTVRNSLSETLRGLFAEQGFWQWTYEADRKELRVLALCFMAAMVESGDA